MATLLSIPVHEGGSRMHTLNVRRTHGKHLGSVAIAAMLFFSASLEARAQSCAHDADNDGFEDTGWKSAASDGKWRFSSVQADVVLYQAKGNGITRVLTSDPSNQRGTGADDLGGGINCSLVMKGVGDFNADGNADILWQDTSTGRVGVWPVNTNTYQYTKGLTDPSYWSPNTMSTSVYDLAAIGDFNGDGKSDIIFHRIDTGALDYWGFTVSGSQIVLSTGTLTGAPSYSDFEIVGTGDFNADGRSDLVWQQKSTGNISYWLLGPTSTTGGITHIAKGAIKTVPVGDYRVVGVGDLDGDGDDDIVLHQRSTGTVHYWRMQGTATSASIQQEGTWSATLPAADHRILGVRNFNGDAKGDLLIHQRSTGRVVHWLNGGIVGTTMNRTEGAWMRLDASAFRIIGSRDYFDGPRGAPALSPSTPSSTPMLPNSSDTSGVVEMLARHRGNVFSEGVYDTASNRTFITYAGCDTKSAASECTSDPWIMYYDHDAPAAFQGPWKIASLGWTEPGGTLTDSHVYPQLVISNDGYLHVFQSGHEHPLRHWKSNQTTTSLSTLGSTNWTEIPFTNSTDQDHATYVLTAKRADGTVYLFYRQTIHTGQQPTGDPCQLNSYPIHEPWFNLQSTDSTLSAWNLPNKVIDPRPASGSDDADEWDTIYVKSIKYEPARTGRNEQLHFTFALTQYHNCYYDKLYYARMDLGTQRFYTRPTGGTDLGVRVTQDELNANQADMMFHQEGLQAFRNVHTLVGIDNTNAVHIFYTSYDGTATTALDHVYWNGSAWTSLTRVASNWAGAINGLDVNFRSASAYYDLFVTQAEYNTTVRNTAWMLTYNSPTATGPSATTVLLNITNPTTSFHEGTLVKNGADSSTNVPNALRFLLKDGTYTDWKAPKSNGKIWAWGNGGMLGR